MKTIYKKLLLLLLLLPISVLAQSVFNGTVVDRATGQPLSGVNVQVQGTNTGSATDFDGAFKLSNVKTGAKVIFTYVGYENATITFNGQKDLKVVIEESSSKLSEVVIQVGYGTAKKKDLTGSTTTITTKDFNKGANVTAENLLQGRVAGLTINTSGAPGSGSEIRIRGGASLFANNDPLVVIDGLPIDNSSGNNVGSTNFLASLNPATIESITVLKDASATAIYGSRASNGVIIVTTKKGGKTLSVDYNVQYGVGQLVKTIDVFDADQFRKVVTAQNPSLVPRLGNANTDWQRAIYRDRADFLDQNISLRGNLFGFIPARLTVGKTFQEGLRLTNTYNRNTVGVSLNPSFFDNHLKIKLNANYGNENNRFADGVEGDAIRFDPTQPIYQPGSFFGGYFEYTQPGLPNVLQTQTPRNPVARLEQTNDSGRNNRLFGNFEVDYKFHFLPSLRAVVNLGFDEAWGERRKLVGTIAANGGQNNNVIFGTNEFSSSLRKNVLLDAYFVYAKTFDKLNFDFTAGYSYQRFEATKFETRNVNDPSPLIKPITRPEFDRVLIGYFGRTNLNYRDKYLLTLSLRRDGTSAFEKKNWFGYFPAVGFAWKMKEEFFNNNKTISDLKFRLGYGITGQQNVQNNNDYIQLYNIGEPTSQIIFGNTPTPIAISARLSDNLKWEETTTYNAGVDFGLFNNRISGTVEAYYKDSKDLIALVATAEGSNFSNRSYQNFANLSVRGVELTINADIFKSNNFNWNVNFNASSFQRRVESLGTNAFVRVGENVAGTGTQGQVHQPGFSPFSYYVFKQLYDSSGNPIEGGFADLNGDGVINSNDKYIYKNPDPNITFGFASQMNYKNIDFSFNLRSNIGNRVLNVVNSSRAQYQLLNTGNAAGNIPTSVQNTGFINQDNQIVLSDLYVENASFLRMDNVTLGYTLPKIIEGKASLRFFIGCQNAFVLTKYSGLDPEVDKNGFDNTIYPRQRTYLFGANLKF
jgi:TonB-dependent starch-binding outer membrane protein SusC